ncbi:Release factor glutamine methyltransferase [Fundidesulfovibrio magnetotacticus]|uniref:Release factor glutamine methyltransferase n=1 Tax=Fundidesulfovibrio magnetotacticus TaxID=2730080 RepID=A0A6V8LZG4_9BACT|nr:peptide chain release factor N(5)-glutamine methyltransferase [Fundidesulfovibrio magnetotacticus]GFK95037.1 Release factor glutamine methyltransferase [Fundidesulfovibrio magnetotacticus]
MSRQPTIREILQKTEAYFSEKAVDSPRLSAQLVLAKGLGIDRMALILDLDRPLSHPELDALRPLVARRGRGEPTAYILGEREFYSLTFQVGPGVLVPRPETELIVETALGLFPKDAPLHAADLGCGSGCLAVCLAFHLPLARVTALDSSPEALAVARANALRHGVEDRTEFVEADFSGLPEAPGGYQLVVSNPPYVSREEYAELSPEVARFEPRQALTPGPTGLEAYPAVLAAARDRLAAGGALLAEIGWKQGQAVKDLFEAPEHGFTQVRVLKDLAGLDRAVLGRKPG